MYSLTSGSSGMSVPPASTYTFLSFGFIKSSFIVHSPASGIVTEIFPALSASTRLLFSFANATFTGIPAPSFVPVSTFH